MNIEILSLFSNQNGIEYTWSNNGGDESEIEKMSKEDFAELLCRFSEREHVFMGSEFSPYCVHSRVDKTIYNCGWEQPKLSDFLNSEIEDNIDYCKECLVKYIQSQNKN